MMPTNTGPITDVSGAKSVLNLVDILDDHDDVQAIHSNVDLADELIAELAGSQLDAGRDAQQTGPSDALHPSAEEEDAGHPCNAARVIRHRSGTKQNAGALAVGDHDERQRDQARSLLGGGRGTDAGAEAQDHAEADGQEGRKDPKDHQPPLGGGEEPAADLGADRQVHDERIGAESRWPW